MVAPFWHVVGDLFVEPVAVHPIGRNDDQRSYVTRSIKIRSIVDYDFGFACALLHEQSERLFIPTHVKCFALVIEWLGLEKEVTQIFRG